MLNYIPLFISFQTNELVPQDPPKMLSELILVSFDEFEFDDLKIFNVLVHYSTCRYSNW